MEIEYIERLKICVEETIGKKLKTPKDFTNLSEQIFNRLHIMLSPTTLKRLWGYLNEDNKPRISTLSIISQFVGYRDWENFCESDFSSSSLQSNIILSRKISTYSLEKGQQICVTWLPDRKCIFEYLGELTFLVVDSINSKLEKGDTFQCSIFIEGEALYLDKLKHKRYTDVSYIAGKNEGIRFEIL